MKRQKRFLLEVIGGEEEDSEAEGGVTEAEALETEVWKEEAGEELLNPPAIRATNLATCPETALTSKGKAGRVTCVERRDI